MGIFSENSERRRKHQRRLNKLWMILVGVIAIVAGIGLIYFSSHLPENMSPEMAEVVSSTLMPLGQVMISVAVTALLFEHFGYVDYTTNRVCDALAQDEVLNVLSDVRKKELKDLLFEDIYLGHEPLQDPLQLVRQLDQDTNDLLADYYYEEYHTSCDISLITAQDGQQYFRKYIHRTFTAKAIQAKKPCELSHLYYHKTNNIPGGTKDESGHELLPLEFINLYFNDRPLELGKDYTLVPTGLPDEGPYSIHYSLELKDKELLKIPSQGLRVTMIYRTHVLSTDPSYAITVDRPCKSFSCHFSKNIPNYNIHVKSYGFMTVDNTTRTMQIQTQNGVTVRFRTWILPGDGAVAMLTPKQSMPACPMQTTPPVALSQAKTAETAGIL